MKYFEQQRQSNRSKSSMEVVMFGVQHFCVMNDILINIKKISKFKRSLKNKNTDFAYTHADILKLTSVMPLRIKVYVMIFASTGIRKGTLPPLRSRNLKKIDNLYKFTIYEGDREQYTTFCTPECVSLIDSYLDYRTRSGEKLTPESCLIRELQVKLIHKTCMIMYLAVITFITGGVLAHEQEQQQMAKVLIPYRIIGKQLRSYV